ncbi:MAG: deoxyribose-phosphate aldolase [Clostridia bacterium]
MEKNLASLIDHTLLKPATKEQIIQLCAEAKDNGFASVCVLPDYIALCAKELNGSKVEVCTVVGFPLGENTTATKVFETENAISLGATEIDMVINASWAKSDMWEEVQEEISAVVASANHTLVKVIIETCLLSKEKIVKACEASILAGAQFVKTSTGFSSGGATVEAVEIMAKTVHSKGLKVKASGGIHTRQEALSMVEAGADRIGTSSGLAIIK